MRQLRDRVAVVTGAASGIGRETSILLAREGCELAVADINEDGLNTTAENIRELGRTVTTHVVDVSSRTQMEEFAERVVAEHGRVHVVVNNAGVSVHGTFEEQSLEDIEWIVGINFWGVVYGCKIFLPHLLREDEGHIVNLSSLFGIVAPPSQSTYCATKFAVRGLSEALWEELADTNVGVTCVHPGGIKTGIVNASRTYDEETRRKVAEFFTRYAMSPEKAAQQIVRGIRRGSRRVMITAEARAIDLIKRMFPVWGNRTIARVGNRFRR